MIRIGITGQSGFVGTNLSEVIKLYPERYQLIEFKDSFWEDDEILRGFVKQCDVIVHLAALVRSKTPGEVYDTNIKLGNQLINAMIEEHVKPCVMFASSIQEFDDTEYGRCKHDTRIQLSRWAEFHQTGFAGMIFPNLFGPKARPNSHSFIATFCYKLTHQEEPTVLVDNNVSLKYIGNLVQELMETIDSLVVEKYNKSVRYLPDFTMKVTKVLEMLQRFKEDYINNGNKPVLNSDAERNLFETFVSYKNYQL